MKTNGQARDLSHQEKAAHVFPPLPLGEGWGEGFLFWHLLIYTFKCMPKHKNARRAEPPATPLAWLYTCASTTVGDQGAASLVAGSYVFICVRAGE